MHRVNICSFYHTTDFNVCSLSAILSSNSHVYIFFIMSKCMVCWDEFRFRSTLCNYTITVTLHLSEDVWWSKITKIWVTFSGTAKVVLVLLKWQMATASRGFASRPPQGCCPLPLPGSLHGPLDPRRNFQGKQYFGHYHVLVILCHLHIYDIIKLMFLNDVWEGLSVNEMGPSTDPWGTPNWSGTGFEKVMWRIAGGQKDRKRAPEEFCLEFHNEHSIFFNIIWCSSVSNAVERSRNETMDVNLLSAFKRLSVTASSAVSVLCPFLCADWWTSSRPLALRCPCSCVKMTFSIIFETNGRLDMGL